MTNIPNDFNWKEYISLNSDLNHIKDKKTAKNHYLSYGINENRPYKYKLPSDFNWKAYISLNSDLNHITTEKMAIEHFLKYGIFYKKMYKKQNYINDDIYDLPSCNNIINNNKKIIENNIGISSSISEKNVLQTRPFFKENNNNIYHSNINILDNINSFILVIDFNNGGGGTTFFLNAIVSKYKNHQTFVIARNINNELHININEEYIIHDKYNINESLDFIDKYSKKISFIFVNHFLYHNIDFINKLFTINKKVYGITHDYYNLFGKFQPYYHEFSELIKTNNNAININNYHYLLTQNKLNADIFSQKYHKNIDIVCLPDYKNSYIKYKSNSNNNIVIGIIGNITHIKGKTLLENICNYYLNDPNIEIIVFGHIVSNICTNRYCYNDIKELNNLLCKHKPNILLELSIWPETYSYTLTLSMITKLPILYYKKKFNSVIENRLSNYEKAFCFSSLNDLDHLIKNKKQNFFYTIEPTIYFDIYWDNLFLNKNKLNISYNTPKYNIKPYFVYFPQFHKIHENDILFYENFTDIKNLELYNKNCLVNKLDTPLLSYLNINDINEYNLLNTNLIQKQIDLINYYKFNGFALYYYWFTKNTITNKNMIMNNVLDIFLSDKIDMKGKKVFFIWANENWTNNPAFGENNQQNNIENTYNEESYIKNGVNLLKYFKHDHYLKINNKPVFFVYHNYLLQNLDIFYKIFNNLCICNGFDGIHLVLNTFNTSDSEMYDKTKFNKFYVNFNYKNDESRFFDKKENQYKIDYKKYIECANHINKDVIQTIVWDFNNRPRLFKPNRLSKSTICVNNTEIDKILFTKKILETYNREKKDEIENILLINSFNEWGENMAFEPSQQSGYYNMNVLWNCLFNYT